MEHTFISYSRNDGEDIALLLETTLQNAGFSTWRDVRKLHPGKDFTADIEMAIKSASCVIVVITADSLRDNSFVRREIQYALLIHEKRRKDGTGTLPVIPFICEKDIPPHISIINNEWLSYFSQPDESLKRLLEIVGSGNYTNQPGNQPDDPFRPYLQHVYQRVMEYLNRAIIREIALEVEPSPEAVNAPKSLPKPRRVDMLDLMFSPHHDSQRAESPPAEESPFTTFTEAFNHYGGRVLLLGQPGAGKTITLFSHTRDAIAARLADSTQPLPLLGIIAGWNPDEPQPLPAWFQSRYEPLEKLSLPQNALYLLDGLDELGSERPLDPKNPEGEKYDPRKRFLETFEKHLDLSGEKNSPRPLGEGSGVRALITCRITDYADIGQKIPLNGALTLQPMTDAQIAEYLTDQPELLNLIQSDSQLREIVETPLLLSFFAFAYHDMTDDEKAQLVKLENAGDLRDKIFLTYIEKRYRHEQHKMSLQGKSLPYSLEEMLDILGHLAMRNAGLWGQEENVLTTFSSVDINKRNSFFEIFSYQEIPAFVNMAIQLDILARGEDRQYNMIRGDIFARLEEKKYETYPTYRFVHLMLRDALAYVYSIPSAKNTNVGKTYIAAKSLEHLKDNRAIEALLVALKNEQEEVRGSAAYSLRFIGDSSVVNPLIAALQDKGSYVRDSAALALMVIGDNRAVEPLIVALEDEDSGVRHSAIRALAEIGDNRAVEPLIVALEDEDREIRHRAVEALCKIGAGDTRVVEPLIAVLKDRYRDAGLFYISMIVSALGEFDDAHIDNLLVECLIGILKADESGLGSFVMTYLEKMGEVVMEPLIAVLKEENVNNDVALRIALTLGKIGEVAVEPLLAILKDTNVNDDVGIGIALALGEMGEVAIKPLIAALKDEDWHVRWNIALALGQIGDAAVEPLIVALKDKDRDVRQEAANALGQIGDAAVEPLIVALKDKDRDVRQRAANALGQIGDAAVEPLIVALTDENRDVRQRAANALGKIGDSRAVKPLILLLNDTKIPFWSGERVCDTAAESLEKIGTPEALAAVQYWRETGEIPPEYRSAEPDEDES